ncbi:hypothetical protein CTheo_3391 [Ceratobasidium theobromae]|uniref:Transmembrane protein n=1 Tax=Ceratobasidium theobromae TaxID=1582974 RepID=A0A5N5QNQ9_9AGAM|nr:hypothetical protein CTheo_3391 [Ceratobasidium theobromae]
MERNMKIIKDMDRNCNYVQGTPSATPRMKSSLGYSFYGHQAVGRAQAGLSLSTSTHPKVGLGTAHGSVLTSSTSTSPKNIHKGAYLQSSSGCRQGASCAPPLSYAAATRRGVLVSPVIASSSISPVPQVHENIEPNFAKGESVETQWTTVTRKKVCKQDPRSLSQMYGGTSRERNDERSTSESRARATPGHRGHDLPPGRPILRRLDHPPGPRTTDAVTPVVYAAGSQQGGSLNMDIDAKFRVHFASLNRDVHQSWKLMLRYRMRGKCKINKKKFIKVINIVLVLNLLPSWLAILQALEAAGFEQTGGNGASKTFRPREFTDPAQSITFHFPHVRFGLEVPINPVLT